MIVVKEITKKKDIKKFVMFPIKMYKKEKNYIPCMVGDEMNLLNKKKNPAYEYCETKLFLAYKNKKIVGRICGLINHAYNKKKNLNQIRFCRFDVIDDIEVTKELFKAVVAWADERGIKEMIGPIGFSDFDKQGMLVEGFDEMSNSLTLYNYPYYVKHLEELGFRKDADWVEYQVFTPKEMNERINRVSEIIKKRKGYHVVKLKNAKDVKRYAQKAFGLINEAFAPLYGVVELNQKQIDDFIKQFVPIVAMTNYEYCYIVNDANDNPLGFGVLAPSLNRALKKSNGKMFPLGLLRMMRDLKKNEILDMYILAVKPEYHNLGVNTLILCEGIKSAIKNGVKLAETGPELELNNQVRDQWKEFEVRQHRRRRSWIINF